MGEDAPHAVPQSRLLFLCFPPSLPVCFFVWFGPTQNFRLVMSSCVFVDAFILVGLGVGWRASVACAAVVTLAWSGCSLAPFELRGARLLAAAKFHCLLDGLDWSRRRCWLCPVSSCLLVVSSRRAEERNVALLKGAK